LPKSVLEYDLKNEDLLYFLHIPKTAGTSFFDFLENQFTYDKIYPRKKDKHFVAEKRFDFSGSNLLRGHMGYGIYQSVSKNLVYVTMLRDPIDQVLSRYAQFTSSLYMNKHPDEIVEKIDLIDLLNHKKKYRRFFNPQTRFIASDLDFAAERKILEKKRTINAMNVLEMEVSNKSDEESLQIAKKRLKNFRFVGLTERFKESILLLCYTFGWKPISHIPRVNLSQSKMKKENIPTDLMEKILENTKLDRELYLYGKKIFEERFDLMVRELKDRFGNFENKSIQKMIENRYYERAKLSPYSSIEYTFEKPLIGTGWHLREYLPNNDTIFRWTGPSTETTIEFPINIKNDLKLEITVLSKISEEVLNSLQIFFNDKQVHYHRKGNKIEGKIDSKMFVSIKNFQVLKLTVKETLSPYKIKGTKDPRYLGIAISKISLRPSQQ
jgi:hypothetical protein